MPLPRFRPSAPAPERLGGTGIRPADLRWAWGAIALLLIIRLGYSVWVPPNPDEAYYWLWGRYPALSYYDHPPLLAWVQGLTYQLFGRSAWALRLPNWLSLAGLLATYAWLLRQLSPGHWRSLWLLLSATLLASPLFFNFTLLAWNDHLLLLTVLLANTSLLQWLRPAAGEQPRRRWLLLASQALGLAGLCKYSALLVGLAMALTLLLTPSARQRLRDGRNLLAALSGGIWLLPVLLWNARHGQQSFDYYLTRTGGWQFKPLEMVAFWAYVLLLLSPFLGWLFWQGWQRLRGLLPATYRRLAAWNWGLTLAVMSWVALTSLAYYYWTLTAWLLLLPLVPLLLAQGGRGDRRLWRASLGYGLLAAVLITVNYGLFPLAALGGDLGSDPDSRLLFGWPQVVEQVRPQLIREPQRQLLTTDYRTGALLAWHLDNPRVSVWSDRQDQFDVWAARAGSVLPTGASALIVTDEWHRVTPELERHFRSLEPLPPIEVRRFGQLVQRYWLVRADGWRP